MSKYSKSFTIIELLVVIAIIAVLASIIIVNVNGYLKKARDARRAVDMNQIYKALVLYQAQYGCLPMTSGSDCGPAVGTYSESNSGGWDYSSQGDFMNFLETAGILSVVPVDPINNMTGDVSPAGSHAYRYYCYSSDNLGLHLGYWREADDQEVILGTLSSGGWADPTFICQ